MSKSKIAYQGEPGANSHIACAEVYPDMEPLACATFEDALTAIADGTAALGMIPIENSLAGRVADIHHFLPTSGLHIVGEFFLPIHFQLMAAKGADINGLTDLFEGFSAKPDIIIDDMLATCTTEFIYDVRREESWQTLAARIIDRHID